MLTVGSVIPVAVYARATADQVAIAIDVIDTIGTGPELVLVGIEPRKTRLLPRIWMFPLSLTEIPHGMRGINQRIITQVPLTTLHLSYLCANAHHGMDKFIQFIQ